MFNLDPGKLIVIAVVAIILLGPDKLPQFARQVGGAWRAFNEFRHRMESEVRSTMPDLPPTSEIARLARSPSALLNHLSTMSSDDEETATSGEVTASTVDGPVAAGANGAGETTGEDVEATAVGSDDVEGTEGATGADGAGTAVAPGAGMNGDSAAEPGDATAGAPGATTPATNGRPAVAPQPAEVTVPVDPTLN
ncbi:MAG TPA: twin-arginine translocase TatA/TatE family subunit [Acidimicrobiales bacterium]